MEIQMKDAEIFTNTWLTTIESELTWRTFQNPTQKYLCRPFGPIENGSQPFGIGSFFQKKGKEKRKK